jgi:hypothetical protein
MIMRTYLFAFALIAACGNAAPKVADPPAPRSGQRERAMENCPSAVPGAHTAVLDVEHGVALDITAPTPDAQAEIREAAKIHAQMGPPTGEHDMHTGHHGGPGMSGHCPIIHLNTQVTFVPRDGGARITVEALDPAQVEALRAETRARVMSLEIEAPRP